MLLNSRFQHLLFLFGAPLAALFSSPLTPVGPAQAHHSVTIDRTQHWCAGPTHEDSKNNECDLSNKALTSVPENLFSDPSLTASLQYIDLSSNSLPMVPEGLFSGLSNLIWINLTGNQLTSIPGELFSGLSNLRELRLFGNQLSTVPEDLFSDLSSLSEVSLGGNSLTSIPEDLFSGPSGLESISLSGNKLMSIPEDLFSGLSDLFLIRLHGNDLSGVPADLFDGLDSLRTIQLYSNSLSSVSADLFDGLDSLQTIQLHDNSLSSVPADLFDGLDSLQTIQLENNNLTRVPAILFDGLTNLRTIRLYGNTGLSCRPARPSAASFRDSMSQVDTVTASLPVCQEENNLGTMSISDYGIVSQTTITLSDEFQFYDSDFSPYPSPGGSLIYTAATSSHPDVVQVSMAASELMVTPVSPGTATVMVSLSGTGQLTGGTLTIGTDPIVYRRSVNLVSDVFSYPIEATTPVPIADQAITDDDHVIINLSDHFTDFFNEQFMPLYTDPAQVAGSLTYTATSSNEQVVTVSIADTSLTVTPISLGNSTITVTLSGEGQSTGANPTTSRKTINRSFDVVFTSTATLLLSPESIPEDDGVSTVTATLSYPSSEATTLSVSVEPEGTAVAGDFNLSSHTLTIAAGDTTSSEALTITAVVNNVHSLNKEFTIQGVVSSGDNVEAPADVTLIIEDNELLPTLALELSSLTIGESGESSTVTAMLSNPSSQEIIISVSVEPVAPLAVAGDFTLSSHTLTIAAGSTASTDALTITAVENNVDSPDKMFTIQGLASGGNDVDDPADVTLTITDDDELPTATLILSPPTIGEQGERATVTAMLTHPSSEATTISVSVEPEAPAMAGDFNLSGNTMLTIAAGSTTSSDALTITAVENNVDSPDKKFTIQGVASGGNDVDDPANVTLTITDDDELPTATLILSPPTIGEQGERATVTAMLTHPSSEATTISVSVEPEAPAMAGDFNLSGNTMLTIAARDTTSSGTVTITAVENNVDSPDKIFTIQGVASGGNDVDDPADVKLTITDDDELPTATLILSPPTIGEQGERATVTAMLTHPSSEATTISVSVEPEAPAVAGDFNLSSNNMLTIAAGATTSSGTVTITAVDNEFHSLDKLFTVQATASGGNGLLKPKDVKLTIADDDGSAEALIEKANEQVLPSVLSKVTSHQVAAITGRLDAISSGAVPSSPGSITMEGLATDIADYLISHRESLHRGTFAWDWKQALSGRDFSFSVPGINLAQRGDTMMGASQSSPSFSLWGTIDYSFLEDKIDSTALDGDILSGYIGIDTQLGENMVTGVALAISNSKFDFTDRQNGHQIDSMYKVNMTTINPYVSWSASDALSFWASLGYGRGQTELTKEDGTGFATDNGQFTSFSAGGQLQIWRSGATAFALKLDGTTAHFLNVDVQRGRLAAQLSQDFSPSAAGVFTTDLELGLLMSSVDESGAELAGSLHWHGVTGVSVFGKSRVLLTGGEQKNWGISGGLRYAPTNGREGLMVSLEPSLGNTTQQLLSNLWSESVADLGRVTDVTGAQFRAELAYGFTTAAGLLRPYTMYSISEGSTTVDAGVRYSLDGILDLDLRGGRRRSSGGSGESRFILEVRTEL